MKFVMGILLGFAGGLAGAILFAPEKRRGAPLWPEGHPARMLNGENKSGFRGAVATLQDHVNQAWDEARTAAEQAERDMMSRYAEQKEATEPEPAEAKKK
jgi:hypothetical protein